jgi:hypothetical protein
MPCTAETVQVRAAEIADIVEEEGKPQPRVEWETKKPGPRDCNHDGVENELMSTVQNALRTDCHKNLV